MFGKRDLLPLALVLVGGLNWGLVAIAEFDLVAWVFGLDFGETNAASRAASAAGIPRSTARRIASTTSSSARVYIRLPSAVRAGLGRP